MASWFRTHRIARRSLSACLLVCLFLTSAAAADESPQPPAVKHQVTGLFSVDRVQDLRDVVATLPDVKLLGIDYENAEATFSYDAAKVLPGAKPEQFVERFDKLLRAASFSTFGIKPLSTTPREKLQRVEIPVVGLDCKGCCLGAYEAIYRLDGVEHATASFKEGRVVAWIDPEKTDRATLEAALKKKNVQLPSP